MPAQTKRYLFLAARLLLSAAGVGYILWTVRWNDYTAAAPHGGEPVVYDGMLTLVA